MHQAIGLSDHDFIMTSLRHACGIGEPVQIHFRGNKSLVIDLDDILEIAEANYREAFGFDEPAA